MKMSMKVKRQAKHLFRLCLIDGFLDESRILQVVQTVLQSKRRGCLALAAQFQRLVKLDQARHTAEVESATPLRAELQASIQDDLLRMYGPRVSASFAQNPALIGGMRIRVASDVYDGSVKARLAALEEQF
jgi:F-type H+-transporting ATPase subunit delta